MVHPLAAVEVAAKHFVAAVLKVGIVVVVVATSLLAVHVALVEPVVVENVVLVMGIAVAVV